MRSKMLKPNLTAPQPLENQSNIFFCLLPPCFAGQLFRTPGEKNENVLVPNRLSDSHREVFIHFTSIWLTLEPKIIQSPQELKHRTILLHNASTLLFKVIIAWRMCVFLGFGAPPVVRDGEAFFPTDFITIEHSF